MFLLLAGCRTVSTLIMNFLNNKTENATNTSKPTDSNFTTEHVLEVIVLAILFIAGVLGNSLVLKRSKRVSMFAKRNAYLYIGLSLGDLLVSLVRLPPLLYVSFLPNLKSRDTACGIWVASHLFMFITILTNTVLAVERRMILVTFQRYLVFFTPKKIAISNAIIWLGVLGLCITGFVLTGHNVYFDEYFNTCTVSSLDNFGHYKVSDVTNTIFIIVLGLFPVCVIVLSYGSIILRVIRTNLLKIEKMDDRALYSRLVTVSSMRMMLSMAGWAPFLFFTAFKPLVPLAHDHIRYFRLLDYLVLAQSSISPYIILRDSDFRETVARRRFRFCSTFKSRSTDCNTSKRKSSRKNKQYMTSADFRTCGNTE